MPNLFSNTSSSLEEKLGYEKEVVPFKFQDPLVPKKKKEIQECWRCYTTRNFYHSWGTVIGYFSCLSINSIIVAVFLILPTGKNSPTLCRRKYNVILVLFSLP